MGQLKRQILMWGAIATTTAVLPGLAMAENVSPDHKGGRHGRDDRRGDAKLSVAGRAISRGTTDSYGLQIRGRSGDQPTEAGGRIRFGHKGEGMVEGLMGEITCLSKDANGVINVSGTITRSGKRTKDGKDGKDGKDDKKAPEAPGAPSTPSVPVPTAADDAFLDELFSWDDAELAEPARHGRGDRDRRGDGRRGDGRRGDRDRRGGGELAGKDFAFTIDVPAKPQKFSQPTIGDKGSLTACSGGGTAVEVTRGGFRTRDGDAKDAKDGDGDREERRGRRGWWRR
jgi:hypothetical protein